VVPTERAPPPRHGRLARARHGQVAHEVAHAVPPRQHRGAQELLRDARHFAQRVDAQHDVAAQAAFEKANFWETMKSRLRFKDARVETGRLQAMQL
jgi:hypothetical protein